MLKKILKPDIKIIILSLIFLFSNHLLAQEKYWIFFRDKAGVEFNPYQYFDIKAIERREKAGISLNDSTDFPVNQKYVINLEKISGKVQAELRWFNCVLVSITREQYNKILQLPFVARILKLEPSEFVTTSFYDTIIKPEERKILDFQVSRMQGELFHKNGFTGKGIRIAVFDAGFHEYDIYQYSLENTKFFQTTSWARH